MKILAKLAIVSAMAISANAMAAQLQSLDDEQMSATTGQDGITIKLAPTGTADANGASTIVGADMVIHDRGGLSSGRSDVGLGNVTQTADTGTTGKLNSSDGAIVMKGFKLTTTNTGDARNIVVNVDADSGVGGTAPVLNVNVGLPSNLTVQTGDVYVASSGGINAASNAQYNDTNKAKILDNVAISLNGAKMNIQLGNQPQGALIKLNSSITGGLNISNLNILQGDQATATNGGIGIGKLNVSNAGDATKWDLNANINAKSTGLEISGLGSADIRVENLRLGNLNGLTATNAPLSGTAPAGAPAALGQVALLGLALPNVTISGH